jgi:hypothetical protein
MDTDLRNGQAVMTPELRAEILALRYTNLVYHKCKQVLRKLTTLLEAADVLRQKAAPRLEAAEQPGVQ